MHGDELALKMRREFGDLHAVRVHDSGDLVAIGGRIRGLPEVDEAGVPGGDLDTLVAEGGRPAADRVERVERSLVACELRKEKAGTLHGLHG
jgi:hypothetical protein